tara:strand:+ start:393 stop:1034 length:642 start_codon:yes stop_codon:yes gene_type:complete
MENEINLNLITGIFYSDHQLDIDHDSIVREVLESREYPGKYPSDYSYRKDHYEKGDVQHTFYEDTNLYNHTVKKLMTPITKLIDGMFGEDMLLCNEMWGHIIYPGDQTMVHDHRENIPIPGLSFAYYPHYIENGGDIHFISDVNGKKCDRAHHIKKGDLLLFSNDILHYTPRNGSNETRVTISGNFITTEKFLQVLQDDNKGTNPYWYYNGKI